MPTIAPPAPLTRHASIDALAFQLLAVTQQAALASASHVGTGDGIAADGAATAAMRAALNHVPGSGTVVIGEGEKDKAPMLYSGESVGAGGAPVFDLAVDPLENTRACAEGSDGAITVLAAAPDGCLWGNEAAWYANKLVVGAAAKGQIDITRPIQDNLVAIARAHGRRIDQLRAVVLEKPRHRDLLATLHALGVTVSLIPDGDVAGALRVVRPDPDADLLVGVGGAPEGVITACAVRLLGGDMQMALAPQSDHERAELLRRGHRPDDPLALDDIVRDDGCCFVATGVTSGGVFTAPVRASGGWRTRSLLCSPGQRALLIDAMHPEILLPEADHA